jgi:tyrosinase
MAIKKYILIVVGTMLARFALGGGTPSSDGVAAIPTYSTADIESGKAIRDLSKIAYDNAMARAAKATTGCTKDKLKFRKEW